MVMTVVAAVTVVGSYKHDSMETVTAIQMEKTALRHMAKYTSSVIRATHISLQG